MKSLVPNTLKPYILKVKKNLSDKMMNILNKKSNCLFNLIVGGKTTCFPVAWQLRPENNHKKLYYLNLCVAH